MPYPDANKVRDFIQRKFVTIARFADLAKLSEKDVRNVLKRVAGPALATLLQLAKANAKLAKQPASFEIKPDDITSLRAFIDKHHKGNDSEFARFHNLDRQTLAQVLQGLRKKRSKLVVAIMEAAQVKGYGPAQH